MWFFLNLYLQQVLGFGAFPSGRFGPKATTVTGLAVLAIGMGWLSLVRPDGNFWVDETCRR